MQAIVFGIVCPLIPLLFPRVYRQEKNTGSRELLFRYLIYAFAITVITTLAMLFLCEEGTSFWAKMDTSSAFVLKYLLIQLGSACMVTGLEWWYVSGKLKISVDTEGFRQHPLSRFLHKVLPLCFYLLAAGVLAMNVSLIFDRVLWSDEVFSINLMRNNLPDMMQIISLQEPHPPLYYLWLKLWTELLGRTVPVCHFASVLLLAIDLLLAVTLVRRKFGKIPAAFLIVFIGLAEKCVVYNVEVRMYALAFLAVAFCYYCAVSVIRANQISGWVGMVLWAVVAAYTHYYALLMTAVIMVLASLAALLRFRGRVWIRGILSGLTFFLAYLPWLSVMFSAVKRVRGNWWLGEMVSFRDCILMVFAGENMLKCLLPLLAVLIVGFLLLESSLFSVKREDQKIWLSIRAPRCSGWSAELWALVVGGASIVGVYMVVYLACVLVRPVLTERYLFPLGGILIMMVVVSVFHLQQVLRNVADRWKRGWIVRLGNGILLVVFVLVLFLGIQDYRDIREEMNRESAGTEQTLEIIGEPVEDMVMVNYGVQHIGWNVLNYYYPEAKVINDGWTHIDEDDYWYFTKDFMTEEEFAQLSEKGYTIAGYGEQQIAYYSFVLYHFYKTE